MKKLSRSITKKTKAIVLVHLYGLPYNFDELRKIINKYKLKVIEDCAEAIGSKYKNNYVVILVMFLHLVFMEIKP